VRLQRQAVCVSLGLLLTAGLSMAQSANVYVGVATATDGSNGQAYDVLNTGTLLPTPKLEGVFPKVGASLMWSEHLGVGADVTWRGSRADYSGLLYRPTFYNFDAIWAPVSTKRFEPELHAGVGGMRIGFSYKSTQCDPFGGCQTSDQAVENSTHFQFHLAAAVRIYVTDKVFVRPGIDYHYVHNLFQFADNSVPEYSLSVGYSFGRSQ